MRTFDFSIYGSKYCQSGDLSSCWWQQDHFIMICCCLTSLCIVRCLIWWMQKWWNFGDSVVAGIFDNVLFIGILVGIGGRNCCEQFGGGFLCTWTVIVGWVIRRLIRPLKRFHWTRSVGNVKEHLRKSGSRFVNHSTFENVICALFVLSKSRLSSTIPLLPLCL
jgi:hypothetical protein